MVFAIIRIKEDKFIVGYFLDEGGVAVEGKKLSCKKLNFYCCACFKFIQFFKEHHLIDKGFIYEPQLISIAKYIVRVDSEEKRHYLLNKRIDM